MTILSLEFLILVCRLFNSQVLDSFGEPTTLGLPLLLKKSEPDGTRFGETQQICLSVLLAVQRPNFFR